MKRTGKGPGAILLMLSPPWDISTPPLGIAYLSSYLKKYGHKTAVFDLNIALYHAVGDNLKYLWEQKSYEWWVDDDLFKKITPAIGKITHDCVSVALRKTDFKYIGLSVNFASIKFANELIGIIKGLRPCAKIILGGWGCVNEHMRSLFPKELVDVFVVGEGEGALREVIDAFEEEKATQDIPGAIFNKSGPSEFKSRAPIMALDSIPWPTFSEFDLTKYTTRVLPLFTSRGCISRCSFCNDWHFLNPYRGRSAVNIFEEITYHVENNNIRTFSFKDLLCNANMQNLNLLSDLVINRGLKLQWDSQAIPHKNMTYELLCRLKHTGCGTLIYGVESFSNHTLRLMKKLFTKEIAEKVIQDTHRAGIRTMINIIVGFPGETEQDFQETCEAIERNRKFISQIGAISTCLVNNDSELETSPQQYGLILSADPRIRAKKWETSDGKNNYEMRKIRARKVIELIEQLGLSYNTATI